MTWGGLVLAIMAGAGAGVVSWIVVIADVVRDVGGRS